MKVAIGFCGALAIAGLAATLQAASTPTECAALLRHGHRGEALVCYRALTGTADPYLRAEGDWGLELYQEANNEFRTAVAQSDKPAQNSVNAQYRVRWGRLMHERFNDPEAANLFQEALQRDAKNAEAYVGLGVVSAELFDRKARDYFNKALELNPKLFEAHEVLADLALDDSDSTEATKQADAALELSSDALNAIAVHAAVELLADRSPDAWLGKMLQINPSYGKGYALVASQLVIHQRYEDGVTYYRKAVDLDPRLWSARSQLAINLMRLGQEDEPRQQLQLSYNNGFRDAATVNSLRLLDSYKNFETFKDQTTILRLYKNEAPLLRPYFDEMLKRAIVSYQKKYNMTLPGPVQVEVYPNHDDFAVRTYGMPGLGALGVTFGEVVAMDSPSGRKPGSFNWASTLWHETNHVFVLTATRHRVPRWFAEGLAVHEEGQGNARWANRLTPEIVVAMRDKRLLPIAKLDRGFVHQEYPEQILVSYYQAGRVCDYIQDKWGMAKLLDMMHRFGQLEPTPDVIQHVLDLTPEAFDEQFQAWLYKDVGPIVTSFDEWRTRLKTLVELIDKGSRDEAIKEGEAVRRMYPQYVEDANPYGFLAGLYTAQGNKASALAVLADYQKMGGENPATLKTLAKLREEAGQLKEAAETLDEINEIYPVNDDELHRHLGDLWLAQKNYPGAVREYAAVVAMQPLDKAGALYNLAKAYFAARQLDKAEQNVLSALEAAPGFRPAQALLLQIEDVKK